MKVVVVIPAFNESRTIGTVVEECRKYTDEVIVANDGSADETAEIARARGARVVSHLVNRGYGAALKTGMIAALAQGADAVVTIDADGQHEPNEISKLVQPLLSPFVIASERSERDDLFGTASSVLPPRYDESGYADVVIGDRFAAQSKREGMSIMRRLFITVGNLLTWILYGVWLHDTQSGFRAYTREALKTLLNDTQNFRVVLRERPRGSALQAEGMEFSSEVIGEAARQGMRIALVPITVRYTDYSRGKGQNLMGGITTAFQLFFRRLLK